MKSYSGMTMFSALIWPAAIASAQDASPTDKPAAEWDMVVFEMNSWGSPLSSWRILADGSGSWTETIREEGNSFGPYKLAWHEIESDIERSGELAQLLAALPEPAPDYEDCESRITDQPYGTIRLTRGSTTTEISWNAGCLDEDYAAFLDTLRTANELVEGWGHAAPITRTESSER